MHSSPSLRPRLAAALMASVALASFGCQDSSAPEKEAPAASLPTETEAKPTAAAEPEKSAESAGMTQVGAPKMRSGSSGMNAPSEEDASAPSAPDPKGSQPSMPGTPVAASLACKADSDCKAVDSSCGSCRCLILQTQMEAPTCTGPKVSCVIAPCRYKRAVCSNEMCALKDEGPNTM